jgi:hypothetical protein
MKPLGTCPAIKPTPFIERKNIVKQLLLPKSHLDKLIANGLASVPAEKDHFPVVHLFTSIGGAAWLLTEILPEDDDFGFGLMDDGEGNVGPAYVRVSDLEGLRDPSGLGVERDKLFKPLMPLSKYAALAHRAPGRPCISVDNIPPELLSAELQAPPLRRPFRDLTGAIRAAEVRRLGLGRLYVSDASTRAMQAAGMDVLTLLRRHAVGDWGDSCAEDRALNDSAALRGDRTYSLYNLDGGVQIWIVTEVDRSATGVFLLSEYVNL